ncbi:MAG TPA: hypothetical protein VEY69_11430 [Lautropia sp.]|nr:hypothetical protein [Lautropia sp.]
MKLTWLQRLVMMAAVAMFAVAILDILDMINPPRLFWIVVPVALMLASWTILPSIAELHRANRRRA